MILQVEKNFHLSLTKSKQVKKKIQGKFIALFLRIWIKKWVHWKYVVAGMTGKLELQCNCNSQKIHKGTNILSSELKEACTKLGLKFIPESTSTNLYWTAQIGLWIPSKRQTKMATMNWRTSGKYKLYKNMTKARATLNKIHRRICYKYPEFYILSTCTYINAP